MNINTVTVVLMSIQEGRLMILLEKQPDGYSLPEKQADIDEDLDAAALKLLGSHCPDNIYFRQLYTLGKVDRVQGNRVITTAYISLCASPNVSEDDSVCWFPITKTVLSQSTDQRISRVTLRNREQKALISYEVTDISQGCYIRKQSRLLEGSTSRITGDHLKLINMAMDELQLHVISSGLIFSLLPREFTLKQVQNVYEIISGEKKDTSNFRRDILKMVTPTGNKIKTYNKEALLYSFNPLIQYLKGDL